MTKKSKKAATTKRKKRASPRERIAAQIHLMLGEEVWPRFNHLISLVTGLSRQIDALNEQMATFENREIERVQNLVAQRTAHAVSRIEPNIKRTLEREIAGFRDSEKDLQERVNVYLDEAKDRMILLGRFIESTGFSLYDLSVGDYPKRERVIGAETDMSAWERTNFLAKQ